MSFDKDRDELSYLCVVFNTQTNTETVNNGLIHLGRRVSQGEGEVSDKVLGPASVTSSLDMRCLALLSLSLSRSHVHTI